MVLDAGAPAVLVMTSGNVSDEPICIDVQDADAVGGDRRCFRHHDQVIQVACDESVFRVIGEVPKPVQSRGYPLRRFLYLVVSADDRSRWGDQGHRRGRIRSPSLAHRHIGDGARDPADVSRTFGGVLADLGTCHARGGVQ